VLTGTGRTDWTAVGVTQKVPPDADDSAVPFLQIGEAVGTVWFDDFHLRVVDE
jgi:hypothetical protein